MRIGIAHSLATCAVAATGCQKRRSNVPINVPRPVLESSSRPMRLTEVFVPLAAITALHGPAIAHGIPEIANRLAIARNFKGFKIVVDIGTREIAGSPRRILESQTPIH